MSHQVKNQTVSLSVNPASSSVVLEDFATLRNNGEGTYLFGPYLSGDGAGQVGSLDTTLPSGNAYKVVVPAGGTHKVLFEFVPRSGGYVWPQSYAQSYLRSGTWNAGMNRLRFWVRSSKAIARRADGGDMLEIGTYCRDHANMATDDQGAHYYHILDPNFYANRWHFFEINAHPQHKVSQNPNTEWPVEPELPTVGYMDGLTRFYFDQQGGSQGSTWWFDDFKFAQVTGEPDALVSSICAVYTGTRYEVTWAGPKTFAPLYDFAYKTSSMKVAGFSSGTAAGTVTGQGSAYTGSIWQSPLMSENAGGMYIAIRPQGGSAFTEVFLPQRT